MFSKVVTRAGADQSPVYAFLGESGTLPQWNFSKYVVDKNGKVVAFFRAAWPGRARVAGGHREGAGSVITLARRLDVGHGLRIGGPSTRFPDLVTSTSSSIR